MTWIISASGREVDMRTPRVAHVTLGDIAHSLAQINRFNGHARRPYSVAEHSILVSCIVADLGGGKAAQLAGLMHDAHEAYCGDMATPLKDEVGPDWRFVEGRWASVVRTALDLRDTWADHAAIVKKADLIALATERRDLMPACGAPWEVLTGIQPAAYDLTEPWRIDRPWHVWRDALIAQAERLFPAVNKAQQGQA